MATNVARKLRQLIDKHFPRNSQFHKQFNRSTVKVSYSCMHNMANIISGHNKKVTGATDSPTEDGCNCRDGTDSCVLGWKCLTKGIVYKVTVGQESKKYIRITSTSFKERYNSHKASFKHENKAQSTALSSNIWELKNKNTPHTLLGLSLKRQLHTQRKPRPVNYVW